MNFILLNDVFYMKQKQNVNLCSRITLYSGFKYCILHLPRELLGPKGEKYPLLKNLGFCFLLFFFSLVINGSNE
jgi:hypothetical protein